jgi:hypothetical protein
MVHDTFTGRNFVAWMHKSPFFVFTKSFIFVVCLLGLCYGLSGQRDTITWQTLQQLEYKEAPHEVYGTVYLPVFSAPVKRLANRKVVIRGYLVPVDKTSWALSQNTYASCFFCGKAGPETVIGLNFASNPGTLKMDANAIITGTLIVNGTNVDDWMYSMRDVEILSIKK